MPQVGIVKYKCLMCGYVYDEEKEGKPFSEVTECPACFSPASLFEPLEEETEKREDVSESKEEKEHFGSYGYCHAYARLG